jgi:hypothetical protein
MLPALEVIRTMAVLKLAIAVLAVAVIPNLITINAMELATVERANNILIDTAGGINYFLPTLYRERNKNYLN